MTLCRVGYELGLLPGIIIPAQRGDKVMATVTLTLDDSMKDALEDMAGEMGMNLSTLFMIYAVRVLNDRRIPFYIEAPEDPFYSPANMERLKKSIAQLNAGKGTEHELIEAD